MATKLDDKVSGILHRDKDGSFIPPDEYVVFRPQDNAFPATLEFYRKQCIAIGCDAAQIRGVDNLIARVAKWRAEHLGRLKMADVEPGECSDIPQELHGKPASPRNHMNSVKLFVVGRNVVDGQWQLQGIYDTQEAAVARCETADWFVGPIELNAHIPTPAS